ncbi:aspartate aminotransferase family protein [Subtercola endophyticus]|uniref:aspartate aminotransferase family protein n=1 Tax=Subtercola endophyticus TaxID=2895559 RepID=UPI001E3DD366|nr:aminotransferase class III-fold pyridoxal phosphate-dependent enzyme [Subtercola endophyticus]UFS58605.1 aminotransferase class III-fold pyridoxal phosphate-dependent enzyme [Subtercola endophyticus]
MTDRREATLGASYRLFYRNPVHLVRGSGAYLWDADGNKYLDMYNNVPSVGHSHPRVVAAISEQAATLNTHTRYLSAGLVDYADDLLTTMPDEISQIMFMCTGSEANDLAIRVARAYTGGTGIILSRESYHGNTELTSAHSPALGNAQALDPHARTVAPPDAYRPPYSEAEVGARFAESLQQTIDAMRADGIVFAGLLADSIFSSDGVFAGEPGMLKQAIDVVHLNGGVFIADEVQPGFARTGDAFWGFERHGVVPDIVTMGKPMGNGMPISGMAARPDVLEAFSTKIPYFNTFGGTPVSIAAAQAVLDIIREEGLQERARLVGGELRAALATLAETHEAIGDVRGAGQYTGIELVLDRESKSPAGPLALDVIEGLRFRGVLTSVAGPYGNVLKIRPTLAFQQPDIEWFVTALDEVLTEVGS